MSAYAIPWSIECASLFGELAGEVWPSDGRSPPKKRKKTARSVRNPGRPIFFFVSAEGGRKSTNPTRTETKEKTGGEECYSESYLGEENLAICWLRTGEAVFWMSSWTRRKLPITWPIRAAKKLSFSHELIGIHGGILRVCGALGNRGAEKHEPMGKRLMGKRKD